MVNENPLPGPVTPAQVVEPDPKKPYKAYVAAVVAVLAYLAFAYFFDSTPKKNPQFTRDEFEDALWQGLLMSGLVGGGTFLKKNPLRKRQVGQHERV